MKKIDFDYYATTYNDLMQKQHALLGDISYYSEHKVKITKDIVNKYFKNNNFLNILEYGCGIGRNLPYLSKYFPESKIFAYDISTESLKIAKIQNQNVQFIFQEDIEKYKNKFDLIFVAGVYHHLPINIRGTITSKIRTLLSKEQGGVIIFEHNKYNPLTRHMVSTCEFDNDAILLPKQELKMLCENNGFCHIRSGYTMFVPPIFKKFAFLEKLLHWFPLGGQYYIVLTNTTKDVV